MTEDEAKDWLRTSLSVSRETLNRIAQYLDLLRQEMVQQNLIAEATWPEVWTRHVVDSAQLISMLPPGTSENARWMDLGSGAGFPGIITALVTGQPTLLVESRKKRVEFLQRCIDTIGIAECAVIGSNLRSLEYQTADVITARAFAPLEKLLGMSARFSTEKTVWLLPKGRNAAGELTQIAPSWRKMFHVEQSITDPDAGILVGQGGGKAYPQR